MNRRQLCLAALGLAALAVAPVLIQRHAAAQAQPEAAPPTNVRGKYRGTYVNSRTERGGTVSIEVTSQRSIGGGTFKLKAKGVIGSSGTVQLEGAYTQLTGVINLTGKKGSGLSTKVYSFPMGLQSDGLTWNGNYTISSVRGTAETGTFSVTKR